MTNKQRNAAITAKIDRYTQEHTATKDLALEAIQRATMTNKTEAMDRLIAQDADLIVVKMGWCFSCDTNECAHIQNANTELRAALQDQSKCP